MRGKGLAWVAPFLAALQAGAGYREAARVAGVHTSTVHAHSKRHPEFAGEMAAFGLSLRRGGAGPRTFTDEAAERLLALLRSGMSLKGACEQAGVPRMTVRGARRVDEEFDEAVVAAAAQGGTVLSRLQHLACPGERCGTITGYQYGCSRDACRAAAAAKEKERRARG